MNNKNLNCNVDVSPRKENCSDVVVCRREVFCATYGLLAINPPHHSIEVL